MKYHRMSQGMFDPGPVIRESFERVRLVDPTGAIFEASPVVEVPSFWPCCPLAQQVEEGGHGGGRIWLCPLHGDEITGRTSAEHEIAFLQLVSECLSPDAKAKLAQIGKADEP